MSAVGLAVRGNRGGPMLARLVGSVCTSRKACGESSHALGVVDFQAADASSCAGLYAWILSDLYPSEKSR
jgi:hypothetical protein